MAINAESVSMAWHPHVLTTDMRLSSPKHVHTPASVELKTIETNLPITICSVKVLHQKDFRVITYSLTYLPLLLDTYWNKSRDIFLFMPMMITDNIIHSTSKAICPLFVRRYTVRLSVGDMVSGASGNFSLEFQIEFSCAYWLWPKA